MARSDNLGERIRIALGVSIAVFAISLSYWGIYSGQQSEAAIQGTTTINFDDRSAGQISGTTYPDLLITSSEDPTANLFQVDNPNCRGFAHPSPPNALYNSHPGGNSPLIFAFTNGQVSDSVSLQITQFTTAGSIKVEALDSTGAVVDTKSTQPQANSCNNTPITLTPGSSPGIARIRMIGEPSSTGFWGVDDFSYGTLHQPISNFSFSATPLTGTAPLTVTTTYTGQGSATPLNWDFGDGQTVQNGSATVQHTYQAAGTYVIKLTSNTLTATKSITVTTATPLPPTLLFSTSKSVYGFAELITFTLTNKGPGSVTLPNEAPYTIRSQDGKTTFTPIAAQSISTLSAGQSKSWSWNQQLPTEA
ncbi:MAG: PKD domain-containing protein, partial [Patescibacteria group bacterium]